MSQLHQRIPPVALHEAPPPSALSDQRLVKLNASDALAGAAGGAVSVLFGQPFDLIRVRLQTTNSSNVWRVAKNVWIHEGPLAFYKGAALPFLGVGAAVSVQFMTYHSVRKAWQHQRSGQRLSTTQNYFAGGAAGIANSLISGPIEHIRTRLQVQPHGVGRLYSGPRDCIRQIVARVGFSGIFKAFPVHLVKEFQAFGCYFAAFELSMQQLGALTGKRREDLSALESIPCGALAGMAFWLGSFPLDLIKTKLQSDGFGSEARFRSTIDAVRETWRIGGIRGFWRGLSPTLVRTSLSSAGCFATVEQVRKLCFVNADDLDL